jgi:Mn2+/Fe2+ NRAMP family transporter
VQACFGRCRSFFRSWHAIQAAATLHTHGKTQINSAAEAAEALRPIAGPLAALLFNLGVIGTGLLALPVLGGTALSEKQGHCITL